MRVDHSMVEPFIETRQSQNRSRSFTLANAMSNWKKKKKKKICLEIKQAERSQLFKVLNSLTSTARQKIILRYTSIQATKKSETKQIFTAGNRKKKIYVHTKKNKEKKKATCPFLCQGVKAKSQRQPSLWHVSSSRSARLASSARTPTCNVPILETHARKSISYFEKKKKINARDLRDLTRSKEIPPDQGARKKTQAKSKTVAIHLAEIPGLLCRNTDNASYWTFDSFK